MLGYCSLSSPLIACAERNLELKGILIFQKSTPLRSWVKLNHMALRDHYLPTTHPPPPPTCLKLPDIMAAHYEIKPSIMQSLPYFLGLSNENRCNFLNEFLAICSTIKLTGFTEDALRMRLFPFSLKERAKHWFNSLSPNSIASWAELQQEFLKKYFPIGKTNDIRRAITSISQYEGEKFHET